MTKDELRKQMWQQKYNCLRVAGLNDHEALDWMDINS